MSLCHQLCDIFIPKFNTVWKGTDKLKQKVFNQQIINGEVSDLKWLTLDECLKMIRPYNLEKKEVIKNIDNVLHKYRLIL